MGNATLNSCQHFLDGALDEEQALPFNYGYRQNLHLKLRVDVSPTRPSMGAFMHGLRLTDEFEIEALEMLPALGPLSWRHEQSARSSHSSWPGGPRTRVPMRFVRVYALGRWFVMAVATEAEYRTMEKVCHDIEDSKDAATYAHSFNAHLLKTSIPESQDDEEGPKVRVCAPVGCRVLASAVPQLAHPGAVVMLVPYPATEVRKFVFNGSEDFDELPQAFFHHVVCMSGGRESLYDVQGIETEDGDFWLIDPCIVRTPKSGLTAVMTNALTDGESRSGPDSGPTQQSFDTLHPKCGQLCRSFDAHRRGAKVRKICGVDTPHCGLP